MWTMLRVLAKGFSRFSTGGGCYTKRETYSGPMEHRMEPKLQE